MLHPCMLLRRRVQVPRWMWCTGGVYMAAGSKNTAKKQNVATASPSDKCVGVKGKGPNFGTLAPWVVG